MKVWILKLEVKCARAEGLWKTSSIDRVRYGWRTSAVPGCSPEINARGRCDVFILKRSALRAAATRWCGREFPRRSGSLSSQGLPVPNTAAIPSSPSPPSCVWEKGILLVFKGEGVPFAMFNHHHPHSSFQVGSKCFTRMLFKEGSRAGHSLLRRLSILLPVYLAANQYSGRTSCGARAVTENDT